jgi:hypothetical protein
MYLTSFTHLDENAPLLFRWAVPLGTGDGAGDKAPFCFVACPECETFAHTRTPDVPLDLEQLHAVAREAEHALWHAELMTPRGRSHYPAAPNPTRRLPGWVDWRVMGPLLGHRFVVEVTRAGRDWTAWNADLDILRRRRSEEAAIDAVRGELVRAYADEPVAMRLRIVRTSPTSS